MTRIGWCPGGRTVADMLALYPGTRVVRIFVGAGKPIPTWDGPVLGPLVALGVVVHLSYKTRDMAAVRRLVDGKPVGLLLILTFAHEPEQGTAAGDPTEAEFHAGWVELVDGLADHPLRGEVLLVPVYTRFWWQAHPGDMRWLLDVPVDAIGWDVYNNGASYRAPDDLLSIPRAIADRTGLPYLIAELGAVDVGPGRSEWMRAMVAAADDDGALTCCWFHKDEWDLTGQPEQQTLRDLIAEEAPVTTTAPDTLKAARALLLDHLPLGAASVGIVGDTAHRGGYHCGSDRVVSGDYSVVESARDRTGLAQWACALDVGTFTVSVAGKRHDLPSFSVWLVAQCKAGTEDTRDIREVIYSPDGTTVRRWDRLGKRTTGDSSHLFHTHISFHRDAIKAGRDQTAVFHRYLTTIGLIEAPNTEDDMTPSERWVLHVMNYRLEAIKSNRAVIRVPARTDLGPAYVAFEEPNALAVALGAEGTNPAELAAALAALPQMDPKAIAAAIPPELAKQVADELAARLTS